ncbi:MAG: hypothetical protein NT090_00765 [Acidobacteria bacterium]|nr:hypothetical protein [Acidobacteriota bacterium]
MVAEYEASGLGREEFCRERGLGLSTLGRYRKRRQQERDEAVGPRRWVAVDLSGPRQAAASVAASGLAVVLASGRRIEAGRGLDAKSPSGTHGPCSAEGGLLH